MIASDFKQRLPATCCDAFAILSLDEKTPKPPIVMGSDRVPGFFTPTE
jgi:hypothetical protein